MPDALVQHLPLLCPWARSSLPAQIDVHAAPVTRRNERGRTRERAQPQNRRGRHRPGRRRCGRRGPGNRARRSRRTRHRPRDRSALARPRRPRRPRLPADRVVHRPRHGRDAVRAAAERHLAADRLRGPYAAGHRTGPPRPDRLHPLLRPHRRRPVRREARGHRDRRRDPGGRTHGRLAGHPHRRHRGAARRHPGDPRPRAPRGTQRPARRDAVRRPYRAGQGRQRRHTGHPHPGHARGGEPHGLRLRRRRARPARRRRGDQHRLRQPRRHPRRHLGQRPALAADDRDGRPGHGAPRPRAVDPPRGHRTRRRRRTPPVRHRRDHR